MNVPGQIVDLADERRNPNLAGPELLPVRSMKACATALPVAAAGISLFSRADHRVVVPRRRTTPA